LTILSGVTLNVKYMMWFAMKSAYKNSMDVITIINGVPTQSSTFE